MRPAATLASKIPDLEFAQLFTAKGVIEQDCGTAPSRLPFNDALSGAGSRPPA